MSFAIRNLSVLAYANGFTLWHYKAGKDRPADVRDHNYFLDACDMLSDGDIVLVSSLVGAVILVIALAVPTSVVTAKLE